MKIVTYARQVSVRARISTTLWVGLFQGGVEEEGQKGQWNGERIKVVAMIVLLLLNFYLKRLSRVDHLNWSFCGTSSLAGKCICWTYIVEVDLFDDTSRGKVMRNTQEEMDKMHYYFGTKLSQEQRRKNWSKCNRTYTVAHSLDLSSLADPLCCILGELRPSPGFGDDKFASSWLQICKTTWILQQ